MNNTSINQDNRKDGEWFTSDAAWYSRDPVKHESYNDAIAYVGNSPMHYIDSKNSIIMFRGAVLL